MKQLRILLVATILLASCQIRFTPTKDIAMMSSVSSGMAKTDQLYQSIISAQNKSFPQFADSYSSIQASIDSVISTNQNRARAKQMVVMAQNLSTLFHKYTDYHRNKNTLSDTEAAINNSYIQAMWRSILLAERSF